MTIETTILDFQLSNTFEQYESHMNAEEQQSMFEEMGVKTFYIGKSLDDPRRAMAIRAWLEGDLRLAIRLLQWANPNFKLKNKNYEKDDSRYEAA